MLNKPFTRREFLTTTAQGAAIAGVLSPLLGSNLLALSKSVPAPVTPITLDLSKAEYSSLATTGGSMKITIPGGKEKPIIVCRVSETQVTAFSSKCTHFGCEVSLPVNDVIKCPCHGATFDGTGHVTHGPAGKDLKKYSALIDGTNIIIKDIA